MFSMKNGRENRNNGNQEKGKEEKETLRKLSTKLKGDAQKRPLSFCDRMVPTYPANSAVRRCSQLDAESASPSQDIDSDTRRNCSASPASLRTCHPRFPGQRLQRGCGRRAVAVRYETW